METEDYSVYIFGDSHSRCFSREEEATYGGVKIHNKFQSSVSMKGLTNPTNTLNYNNVILDTIKSLQLNSSSNIVFVMKFGQVDIEYNYYYKLHKKGENIVKKVFYDEIIGDYINYITSLKNTYPNIQFIVNGVNMPNHYDIAKYIQQVIHAPTPHIKYKDQFEGNSLFNKILQTKCELNEIPYFDLTSETTTRKSIKKEFIGRDHHLSGAEGVSEVVNNNTYRVFRSKLFDTIKCINKPKQMNQNCIYTFIVGDYDELKDPKIITPGWDYICVTDNPNLKSSIWKIIYITKEDRSIHPMKRRAMALMIGYRKYLPKHYDVVITIGGQCVVNTDLNDCLKKHKYNSSVDACFINHPNRNCVYVEGDFIIQVGRDTRENITKHLKNYKSKNYPANNGLYASGVMIINNNSKKSQGFFQTWLSEYKSSPSMRDQMSFNYSLWKYENKNKLKLNINEIEWINIFDHTDFYTTNHIKTHKEAMTTKTIDLEEKINQLYQTPSDINEHIPTIIKYGQECEHITEMGVRSILSTWGWLASAPPNGLVSYDLHNPSKWGGSIQEVEETAKAYGIEFEFIEANVLEIDIEETDLLFIDTWHHYNQLKAELKRHSDKARKYICFHDTTSYEHHSEPTTSENGFGDELVWDKGLWDAVTEFLDENRGIWKLKERFTNNNGFTIIERIK